MCDRHSKWTRVEPGTVIPAGQPFATRYDRGNPRWSEFLYEDEAWTIPAAGEWFVDSSWRPPLELPTEPTWGIVLHEGWQKDEGDLRADKCWRTVSGFFGGVPIDKVVGWIPLTDEQVARIEANR